jgi:hypothetical protein
MVFLKQTLLSRKGSMVLVALVVVCTLFTLARLTTVSKASAQSTSCAFTSVGTTTIISSSGNNTLGTMTLWTNTCTKQAFGTVTCAIASPHVSISLETSWDGPFIQSPIDAPCAVHGTITSPTITYTSSGLVIDASSIGDFYEHGDPPTVTGDGLLFT